MNLITQELFEPLAPPTSVVRSAEGEHRQVDRFMKWLRKVVITSATKRFGLPQIHPSYFKCVRSPWLPDSRTGPPTSEIEDDCL